MKLFRLIMGTSLLAGCAVGPNYKSPKNNVSDVWSSAAQDSLVSITDDTPEIEWWKSFNDPLLNQYIEKAASHNKDVLVAEANVLQARALRQVAASSFFPQIGADVNATKTYFSKNGPIFAIGPSIGSVPGTISQNTGLPFALQVPQIQNLYNALFDAAWEIDLFGKTRRTVEAATAKLGSAIELRNDTLITIMAEVAIAYVEIRSNQKRAMLIEDNIELLEKKTAVIDKQKEVGYVSDLDVQSVLTQLANERAALPLINAAIYQGIYTLSVLIGDVPETLLQELLPKAPLPKILENIAVGLRSDLLRRRPDVRIAERKLAAATADVGVAVASFFPTITLLGDGGLQSLQVKNLFTAASRTWAIGGDINMPVFEGGRLVGNLRASRAAASAAAYVYQQTVLKALQETESALVSYTQDIATTRDLEAALVSSRSLVFLSEERYNKGLVNLLNLIEVERECNLAEQNLLTSETASLTQLITLYKALGGGWQAFYSRLNLK